MSAEIAIANQELSVLEKEVHPEEGLPKEQDLNLYTLHIEDMRQFPLEVPRNKVLGQQIFFGKLALHALTVIDNSSLATLDQKKSIAMLFEDRVAKLLLEQFNHTSQRIKRKLQIAEGKGQEPDQKDAEFVQIVEGQTEWVKGQIESCGEIDIGELREQQLQRFIESWTSLVREGIEARQSLIQSNWRLAVFIAKRVPRSDPTLLDLVGYAEEGLTEAATKFDYRLGPFAAYAVPVIRGFIQKGICESLPVCLPRHTYQRLGRFEKERARRAQELGEDPDLEELAREFDTEEGILVSALGVQNVVSLNRPSVIREGEEFGDSIPDDIQYPQEIAERNETREEVRKALDDGLLDSREREVLILRFGIRDGRARTHEEVGGEFNLTRARIQQIEAKALSKLRLPKLREYLPYDPKAIPTTADQEIKVPYRFKTSV